MTTPRATILWVDNDPAHIYPFSLALADAGYVVTSARTLFSAAELLRLGSYDLLILDVMIPLTDEDESQAYSPEWTDCGDKAGLAFYQRHRDELVTRRVPVLVMTVRVDLAIVEAFVAAGLPRSMFVSKMSLRDTASFLEKIRVVIDEGKV
ncbi:MAG: response regulator [Acidobacteriota bacterium]